MAIPPPDKQIRVVMVGKTGCGKSAMGNSLLNHSVFLSETKVLDNRAAIEVIDAPGLFDTKKTITHRSEEFYSSFCLTPPGPHVFVYVIKIDDRITDECIRSFNLLKDIFGPQIIQYLVIVFNWEPKDRDTTLTIQESEYLKEIIKECQDRYVCLDDVEKPSYGNCGNLLNMILDTVRRNGGSHYTRDMYSRAVEQYNAKLKLVEDNRKLAQQVQVLKGLIAKEELKNKQTGFVERGRMPTAQFNKIQANYIALQKHIENPRDLCGLLFSASVFDEEYKRIIESKKDRIELTDKLLMTLTECGQSAYDKFLLALSATGHYKARQILEQDACEDVAAVKDNRYLGMNIKFPDLKYHSEYSDPNSDKYKELKDELETLIREYGCDATVISLSHDPVVVSFVFTTSSTTDDDNVLEILHKALKPGYLGHYKVSTDDFLFCRIGAWLTNRNTDDTEEVTPVIGDENTVSSTEQQSGGVIVECVLTTSKSELNNLHPILETAVKSGSFGPYKVSTDQFSFHQIGGWLNEKAEKSDELGAGASSVMLNEQATLPDKMKTDKSNFKSTSSSRNIRKRDAEPLTHSSSRMDTSSTSDVSVTPQTEPVMSGTDYKAEQHPKVSRQTTATSDREELRVVLVGKTGRGKSALGNSLLRSVFGSSASSNSVTSNCTAGYLDIQGDKRLVVVDTPGLFDTRDTNDEISKELVRCIALACPGPHAFLFVLSIDRFTQEELDTVDHLRELFGEEVMRHVICVFSCKDSLETKGITLEEYIQKSPPQLRSLIDRCGGRVATINNRAPTGSIEGDVNIILSLVEQTILSNCGKHYTDAMFVEAEKVYQSRVKERKEELAKQGQRLMEYELREHFRRQVEENDGILLTFAKGIHNVLTKTGTVIRQTIGSTWLELKGCL
ncbi:uncharacterized protein LOC126809150 [Patella vulgata]|uniref:uncharacterized protein LOC126809150 n=1 Tax=Patella vulgata TaxID=6465 RepID=UPI0021801602|nr:uncharacterized protein LOC126809150 [Patella vulgata]